MPSKISTGLVFDDRYLQHNSNPLRLPVSKEPLPFVEPVDHPSNPRLVERTMKLLGMTGLLDDLVRIPGQRATEDDLLVYHTEWYLEHVRSLCAAGGGDAGAGAPVAADSYEVSMHSAGGVKAAVDAVMKDDVRQCYALVRPPGHHAMAEKGMGFCVFANVVAAAHHARKVYGLERVLILDWDVHHGNGTQDAFYADPNVMFISLHQDRWFPPDFGWIDQSGTGDGTGYTVNIPMPAGSGNVVYTAAFDEIVPPIVEQYQPELIIVSAGQDASAWDPLARMILTTTGFRMMTRKMQELAAKVCNGRLVLAQEGGYSEPYAPYCTMAIFEELLGRKTGLEEPLDPDRVLQWPSINEISGDQRAMLDAVRAHQSQFWKMG
ncbi:MAG: class II histone deacetylase [Sphaerobacteraceae bacterium]|nr:MAG: class II histone deacetylase [Sphaerobacteraceae bacterium]